MDHCRSKKVSEDILSLLVLPERLSFKNSPTRSSGSFLMQEQGIAWY